MDDVDEVLRNITLEELGWLCSLSESELDMLICLKLLVLHCATMIGDEELAQKFDLKMLRAIGMYAGFILMEYAKKNVESLCPGLANSAAFMDCYNLLKFGGEDILSIKELKTCIGYDSKKRCAKTLVRLT
ncbi:hypothetical protein FEM48_Zijuj12G0057700 [Ziziphus jujuba var. spinosa]|uniref:Uncharacterized protein n=1 Tax=Ziziphus jujuba var. spinosa TaxID=714518 RepID=A0A978UBI5_ZIZJJ|nr:hypothetical protein FEM48_Zijuj12G0057700 [Ziziphus jujuba var. spinosa]